MKAKQLKSLLQLTEEEINKIKKELEEIHLKLDKINDLKKSIEFNLKAYFDNKIDAEDCIQAIDEIVNGVIKAPLT